MTRLLNYIQKNKFLVFLFLLFILIRLPFLDQLNLLHDERDIVLSGWSIAKTGKDLFGNSFPLVFENISPNNPLFAIYFIALWFIVIPIKTVFLARLPFLLISSLVVFLSYAIVKKITHDEKKSLITTAILCFNPWIFHITRLALDIPLALVFLFSGIFFYLDRKRLLAYLFLVLTAFTYQGSRLLIPFLLFYLEFFFYIKNKHAGQFATNNVLNAVFIILLIIFASFLEPSISKDRLSEIVFFNNQRNSAAVDFKRISTIAPVWLSRVFDNKLSNPVDEVFVNFTKGLDPNYLFKNGDFSPLNGNAVTGQFLFVFIIFYFFGIISLGKKRDTGDLYLLGLIPLGMIPALLSTNGLSFSIRGVLSSLGYSYLLTLGILYTYTLYKNLKYWRIIVSAVLILLAINLSYFTYGYYFRRPVTVGEMFNENERQLSNFLIIHPEKYLLYHRAPQDILLGYIFFTNNATSLLQDQHNLRNKAFSHANLQVTVCNHKINYLQLKKTIIHEGCLDKKTYDILSDKHNKNVAARIPYKDFSQKYAYFVME